MSRINLLVVEDDEATKTSWQMKLEEHNATSTYKFHWEFCVSLSEAEELVSRVKFDAAIVDLRLKRESGSVPNTDGNDVAKLIIETGMSVIAMFTGEGTQNVVTPSEAVKAFQKGGDLNNVFDYIIESIPFINHIKKINENIQKEVSLVFSQSIWPRWKIWLDDNEGKHDGFLDSAVSRHIVSHVYSAFLERNEHRVHPEEWFFVPAIREGVRTGDIIRNDDGTFEVVITPRCDLARDDKNETVQLLTCEDISKEWKTASERYIEKMNEAKQATDSGQREKKERQARNILAEIVQHKKVNNYHFLPAVKLEEGKAPAGPFFVRFDKLRSVARCDYRSTLHSKRIASVSAEFLPSLVERVGAYFSRIGTPDYSHPD